MQTFEYINLQFTYVIFKDDSKLESGVGAAVYYTDLKLKYSLPNHCSILQAKDFAIRKAEEK